MTPTGDLKSNLVRLYETYDAGFLSSDPIRLVRKFEDSRDQEIVAIIMTSLAFGQVSQILKAGEAALNLMGNSPRHFVETFDPESEIYRWRKWYYRMARPTDLLRLLFALKQILLEYNSIGDWVVSNYDETDEHLGVTWAKCVGDIKILDKNTWKWRRSRGIGFNHLLPDPAKKSACKRAYLLLRWMVRKDSVDLGLWNLPASKLLMPVDTHVQRISYNIGLTDRDDLSIKTSVDITQNLRRLDPLDPVKYDFAICRLGILKMCPKKRDLQKCQVCPIFDVCRL